MSIVIPVFNASRYLHYSIPSALRQTLENIELVCVNDASQDGSAHILEAFASSDQRVRVIHLDESGGASTARNIGIDNALGAHLFFLDADDSMPPDALQNLLTAGCDPEIDLVVGRLLWLKEETDTVPELKSGTESPKRFITDVHHSDFLQSIPGCHCCNLYRKSFMDKYEIRYDIDLTYGEDQLFQAKAIIRSRKVAVIDEIVYFYHHYRFDSMTRKAPTLKNLIDDIEYQRRLVEEFFTAGLEQAGRRFLGRWTYPIREYWSRIPQTLKPSEASRVFEEFRRLIRDYEACPWGPTTPDSHRELLELLLDGQDDRVYELLEHIEGR